MNKNEKQYIEDTTNALIELKMSLLKEKPHYKKYLDIRKKTDAIVNRMLEYHAQDNYNFDKEFKKISEILSASSPITSSFEITMKRVLLLSLF